MVGSSTSCRFWLKPVSRNSKLWPKTPPPPSFAICSKDQPESPIHHHGHRYCWTKKLSLSQNQHLFHHHCNDCLHCNPNVRETRPHPAKPSTINISDLSWHKTTQLRLKYQIAKLYFPATKCRHTHISMMDGGLLPIYWTANLKICLQSGNCFFADMYKWCFSNWFDGIGNDGARSGVYDHEQMLWTQEMTITGDGDELELWLRAVSVETRIWESVSWGFPARADSKAWHGQYLHSFPASASSSSAPLPPSPSTPPVNSCLHLHRRCLHQHIWPFMCYFSSVHEISYNVDND